MSLPKTSSNVSVFSDLEYSCKRHCHKPSANMKATFWLSVGFIHNKGLSVVRFPTRWNKSGVAEAGICILPNGTHTGGKSENTVFASGEIRKLENAGLM